MSKTNILWNFVSYEHLASEVLHTGLPLLIVASQGGFDLVGLDPSQQTRIFLAHFFSFFSFPAFSFFNLAAGVLPSAHILGLSQVAFFPADPSLQVGRAPSAHFSFRPDFTEILANFIHQSIPTTHLQLKP